MPACFSTTLEDLAGIDLAYDSTLEDLAGIDLAYYSTLEDLAGMALLREPLINSSRCAWQTFAGVGLRRRSARGMWYICPAKTPGNSLLIT
jgi:hypothetical protein